MDKRINKISIRGRVAYLILCFEQYVTVQYPDRDWKSVDDMMWKICDDSDFIDNSAYRYMEIIPEYLYEFDTYEELDFDYLSEADYEMYKWFACQNSGFMSLLMVSAAHFLRFFFLLASKWQFYPKQRAIFPLFQAISAIWA